MQVLQEFKTNFIRPYDLFTKHNKTTWVTDGQWVSFGFILSPGNQSRVSTLTLTLSEPLQDLRDFVAKQCYISSIPRPVWLKGSYIDLRSSATAYLARKMPVVIESVEITATTTLDDEGYITTTNPKPTILIPTTKGLATPNIPAVLKALGLEPFEGRQHSGIDDVRNIARILQELIKPERNWRVEAKAKIEGKDRSWYWMRNGKVAWKHPLDS